MAPMCDAHEFSIRRRLRAWSPDGRQIVFTSQRDDCAYSAGETGGDRASPNRGKWLLGQARWVCRRASDAWPSRWGQGGRTRRGNGLTLEMKPRCEPLGSGEAKADERA